MVETDAVFRESLAQMQADLRWVADRIVALQERAELLKRAIVSTQAILRDDDGASASELSAAATVLAKAGGRKGGRATAAKLTAQERKEKAQGAARKRWGQKREGEGEMAAVNGLAEEAIPILRAHDIEQAKPRVDEIKRIAQQKENAQRHDEVQASKDRARGICHKCKGPMGRSPYAHCHSCMGDASMKAEAATVNVPPNSMAG